MKWIYDYIKVERGAHALLLSQLNKRGQQGWQVVSIINNDNDMIAYIKRKGSGYEFD